MLDEQMLSVHCFAADGYYILYTVFCLAFCRLPGSHDATPGCRKSQQNLTFGKCAWFIWLLSILNCFLASEEHFLKHPKSCRISLSTNSGFPVNWQRETKEKGLKTLFECQYFTGSPSCRFGFFYKLFSKYLDLGGGEWMCFEWRGQ